MKLVTVSQMRAIEKEADANGLTYDQMMENAGQGLADVVLDLFEEEIEPEAVALVGPGNNGGDTLVDLGLLPGKRDLRAVVEQFRPTVLIGASGQAGAFTEHVVKAMAGAVERPVILPLSNPTSACEAQPADVLGWPHGRALVATGSPFDVMVEGVSHRVGQGNNAYVFPAIGLAAIAGRIPEVTADVFLAAAKSLAATVTRADVDSGLLHPPIERLREVTRAVAAAVLAGAGGDAGTAEAALDAVTWEPEYPAYEKA